MNLSDEQRALIGDVAAAVGRAAAHAPRADLLAAADHFAGALELLGVERAALLEAHARGAAELERLVCGALGAAGDVQVRGAFARMRRAWVVLGVEPSVVERWDAQVEVAERAGRVLSSAAPWLRDAARPALVEDYLRPVERVEPRRPARRAVRRKGAGRG